MRKTKKLFFGKTLFLGKTIKLEMDEERSKDVHIPRISKLKNLNSDWFCLSVRVLISISCVVVFLILMEGVWDKYHSE
jgi:hypothetical protein